MEAYKKVMWGSTVVAILLTVILIVYFFFIKSGEPQEAGLEDRHSSPTVEPKQNRDTGVEAPVTAQEVPVNDTGIQLNDSDVPVRELMKDFSTHPEFDKWLMSDNLLRRFVASVDNIANGESPRANVEFLKPPGRFDVVEKGDQVIINPRSYIRYQAIPMVLASLETEVLVGIYKKLIPVLEEAYQELGYPGKHFRQPLARALDQLIATPVVEGDVILEEKVSSYAFADPKLEALSEAQKHLLRMGPQNTRALIRKLKEIRDALKKEGLLD